MQEKLFHRGYYIYMYTYINNLKKNSFMHYHVAEVLHYIYVYTYLQYCSYLSIIMASTTLNYENFHKHVCFHF